MSCSLKKGKSVYTHVGMLLSEKRGCRMIMIHRSWRHLYKPTLPNETPNTPPPINAEKKICEVNKQTEIVVTSEEGRSSPRLGVEITTKNKYKLKKKKVAPDLYTLPYLFFPVQESFLKEWSTPTFSVFEAERERVRAWTGMEASRTERRKQVWERESTPSNLIDVGDLVQLITLH